jgi:phage tail sheath protein FI
MPEYLAPGVYVEEVSYRSRSIEGVSTTTTGFLGPCRYGPKDITPDVITSLGEFERIYGDRQPLEFNGGADELPNYLWHGVRAFFFEGGKRLYISRVFHPLDGDTNKGQASDSKTVPGVTIRARFPGAFGNMRVRLTLRASQNVLSEDTSTKPATPTVRGLLDYDVVQLREFTSPPSVSSPPTFSDSYCLANSTFHADSGKTSWTFAGDGGTTRLLEEFTPHVDPQLTDQLRVITVTVTIYPTDPSLPTQVWDGFALDANHEKSGALDGLTVRFGADLTNLSQARSLPVIIEGTDGEDGRQTLTRLLNAKPSVSMALDNDKSSDAARSIDFVLAGGNDGVRPSASDYEGSADDVKHKTGIEALRDIEDISIIAAPGSSFGYTNGYGKQAQQIINLLIDYGSQTRTIAVIDCGEGQGISDVRAMRAQIDSTYAAFYYPWVRIVDPVTSDDLLLPPSGFVCGIYARNDINRAVYKAPANEVVNLATGFEILLNKAQQDVLNPEGINCFRFFTDRGYRLWGARTATSDPEWKYVNLRRYFIYLERSIDKGTQWAVFEPNGARLWGDVRRTIEDFLLNEWQNGALLGDKPDKAFFVRCDRTTMTQNDLDNGRMVCLIGVAALRPAEYVIFRIGQWTGDRTA